VNSQTCCDPLRQRVSVASGCQHGENAGKSFILRPLQKKTINKGQNPENGWVTQQDKTLAEKISMEKDIITRLHGSFEQGLYKDQETGLEFWLARNLQNLLGYDEWRNFLKVIDKAKTACFNSGQNVSDHFVDVNKMVELGSGSQRQM
jgi:hypothetical protein